MIEISIHPTEPAKPMGRETHTASAIWGGVQHVARTAGATIMELARVLVVAGCPDAPWQAKRGNKVALHGPSLHRLAGLVITESDAIGPRVAPYRKHFLRRRQPAPPARLIMGDEGRP